MQPEDRLAEARKQVRLAREALSDSSESENSPVLSELQAIGGRLDVVATALDESEPPDPGSEDWWGTMTPVTTRRAAVFDVLNVIESADEPAKREAIDAETEHGSSMVRNALLSLEAHEQVQSEMTFEAIDGDDSVGGDTIEFDGI